MNPTRISILAILLTGAIFTALLVFSHTNQQASPDGNVNAAQSSASQLASHIAVNLAELEKALESLSYNTFWQSQPVTEWAFWLESQNAIYQAAGISLLGVHAKSNNTLYFDSPSRPGQFASLDKPIQRLYQQKESFKLITQYKGIPSIVLLAPIKNIEGQIIGSVIGIKSLDKEALKEYHHYAKAAVAIEKNGEIQSVSIETSPSLSDYDLVNVEWPKPLDASLWKMVLLVNPAPLISADIIYLAAGSLLSVILLVIILIQLKSSTKNVQLLNDTLDTQLPVAEQLTRLTTLQNLCQDAVMAEVISDIRTRIEQLVQQKKTLSIEMRKLRENEQVLQAQTSSLASERDTAMAAPKIKSEFLSRMGDEITTPMKSVVSMLKLLSEYQFEPEPKQLLNIAKRSTRTLVDNLNNILDFSKLDAQMLKLKPKPFSVRELIDDLSSELSHYANEKGLSLQASCDPDVPPQVKADVSRIRQILRNLLGNAIRFTKQGEVNLYAEVYRVDDRQMLRFTVKDTGMGIPQEAQKGLFDSLEQQTKLTNSSFAGRLRLIVSKNLSELMGGEIGVISESSKGSKFWFTVALEE